MSEPDGGVPVNWFTVNDTPLGQPLVQVSAELFEPPPPVGRFPHADSPVLKPVT
jgi:hypothetical protein